MTPDAQARVCEYTEPVDGSNIPNCRLRRERLDEDQKCILYFNRSEDRISWTIYNIKEAQQPCSVIQQVRGLRAYVAGNPDPVIQIS
ncbi:MAG: hypothetical protein NTW17_02820 [Candidatus Pacearchaeota archaeon]|nr:hypothetical protein [Candidatus Pacearchaeota archaeon]